MLIQFLGIEVKSLRILALGSIILGGTSSFVSLVSMIFGTLMYCTGTGIWGGSFSVFNGVICLIRYLKRNSRKNIMFLFGLSLLTVIACIVSIVLSVIGTSTEVNMCCSKNVHTTNPPSCNIGASQLGNTVITCLTFIQVIFAVMTASFYAKYSFACCNDGDWGEVISSYPFGTQ